MCSLLSSSTGRVIRKVTSDLHLLSFINYTRGQKTVNKWFLEEVVMIKGSGVKSPGKAQSDLQL